MGAYCEFLGQNIQIGELVGDIAQYQSRLGYINGATYFDPIRYAEENGGVPRTDHTYYFYDEDTGDDDPVFAITFTYNPSGRFRVGYTMRNYDTQTSTWSSWSGNNPQYMIWSDYSSLTDPGADPDNITEEDRWRNGLTITRIGMTSTYYESLASTYKYGTWGYALGNEDLYGNGAEYPGPVGCELSYDNTPDGETWHITGGDYYMMLAYNNVQIAFPAFGGGKWMMGFLREIDDFEEDDSTPSGGGSGNYDFSSDYIGASDLPSLSIMDAGIATMWAPSKTEMINLSNYLWTDDFFDNIIKLCADPIENIMMFGIVPFDLATWRGTAKTVKIGNVNTGVSMTPLTNQFVQLDLGYVEIDEAWSTVMDYEPNSSLSMFIPYHGEFIIPAAEFMNAKSIHLTYNVDLFSGSFIAEVVIHKVFPKSLGQINNILYHKSGNLMTKLPITGANYGRIYKEMLNGAISGISNAASGNYAAAAGNLLDAAITSQTVPTERAGQYTGCSAILGCQVPHIILTRPIQVKPEKYNEYEGFPSYITYKLSDLSGFTKCESIIDNKVCATSAEIEEIERLLKEGVFL